MEKTICEKIVRITKNRKKLERELKVKIDNSGKEITVTGEAEDEYTAIKVIEALDFGFPFSVALLIKEEDFLFEVLNIKEYTRRKDLEVVRARIIGKKGKTLKTISDLTKCHFELKGNHLGIIGNPEHIRYSQEAAISLIRGSKQGNVYSYLEKHQVEPVFDLGLKVPKKKKK